MQLAPPSTQYHMSEASCFPQLARFLLTLEHHVSQIFQTIEPLYMPRDVSVYPGVSPSFPWSPAFPGRSYSCMSMFLLCRWGWRKTASVSARKLTLSLPKGAWLSCPIPSLKSVVLSPPNMRPLNSSSCCYLIIAILLLLQVIM